MSGRPAGPAEARVCDTQALEAMGRLAGGIAHDLNSLLTVITGCCDRLLAAVPAESPLRGDLDMVRQSGERAAVLTRQLLDFGRRGEPERRPIDLNAVVRDATRMLECLLGQRTALVTVLDPALGAVEADAGQIELVLMNLAINARDAMPDGGTITVETSNLDVHAGANAASHGLGPGRYAQVAVHDTGHGMDEATAARVFEPFFTTKAPGSGTGLGLSIVDRIVTRAGGQVAVESQPGHGTSMRVFLPRMEGIASRPVASPDVQPVPAPVTTGRETVLVVEDEEFVRELVRDFLRADGYVVLEAASAEHALGLLADSRQPIDLLITDVVLPGMNGAALAEHLSRRVPHVLTLFMSGYPGDSMFAGETFQPGAAFLSKPFTRQGLAGKVREVLATRGTIQGAVRRADCPARVSAVHPPDGPPATGAPRCLTI
ncbi:MAG: response regulator [Acidobacteria bacterium]|nr:response regulator [Acidobacteriota bacterium]